MRVNAPARLSANGRAVSLRDFERLARRHAAILRARAEEVPTPTAARLVLLTLVPVGGAPLTATLENDLRAAIFPAHHQVAYVRAPSDANPAHSIAIVVEDSR